jgi:phage terminase large subunit-like protein
LHPYKGWNRSLGEIRLNNGSRIKTFSGEEPERLRGPQHHGAWIDELAAFRYMQETWDQLKFGLRLGQHPQTVVTTTPKPKMLLKDLMKRDDGTVRVTRGTTFDNAANLAPSALAEFLAKYENTRLGQQELYGEIMDDIEGALWSMSLIDRDRYTGSVDGLQIVRRVVSVDPAVTANEESDETGIVVVSRDRQGHGYVEADYSFRGSPLEWATRVVNVFDEHECDAIVIEVNQGGDMVAQTLRTVRSILPIREVRASKGKRLRAEPISALYEQGRVHHVGMLHALEAQMTSWTPDDPKSPDRLDALVHGLTDLMEQGGAEAYLRSLAVLCACGYPNTHSALTCERCGAGLANVS